MFIVQFLLVISSIQNTIFSLNVTEKNSAVNEKSDVKEMLAAENFKQEAAAVIENEKTISRLLSIFNVTRANHYWTRKRGREPSTTTVKYWTSNPYLFYYPSNKLLQSNKIPGTETRLVRSSDDDSQTSPQTKNLTKHEGESKKNQNLETLLQPGESNVNSSPSLTTEPLQTTLPQTFERRKQKPFMQRFVPKL